MRRARRVFHDFAPSRGEGGKTMRTSRTVVSTALSTCYWLRWTLARRHIRRLQDSFTALERCRKPVFCAVQGANDPPVLTTQARTNNPEP